MFEKIKILLHQGWIKWEELSIKFYEQELERMVIEGCEFCGHTLICLHCQRCHDPDCNAGCISCRTFPLINLKCSCCGNEKN